MNVDPFWFGVLMTIVVEIGIVILITIFSIIRGNDYDETEEYNSDVFVTEDEFKAIVSQAVKETWEEALKGKKNE